MEVEVFKTTIERVSDGKTFFFYTNGYEQLLEGDFFTNKCTNGKTLEEYCFADKIKERFNSKQLKYELIKRTKLYKVYVGQVWVDTSGIVCETPKDYFGSVETVVAKDAQEAIRLVSEKSKYFNTDHNDAIYYISGVSLVDEISIN